MQFRNRLARLERHQVGADKIGPIIVHFVSPDESEDYGKGFATFPGTRIPQISREDGESREEFSARAERIWDGRNET